MNKKFYSSLGLMALLLSSGVYALPPDVLRALDEPDKPKIKKNTPVHKEQRKLVKKERHRKKHEEEVDSAPVKINWIHGDLYITSYPESIRFEERLNIALDLIEKALQKNLLELMLRL